MDDIDLNTPTTINGEVVLSERVVSTEFIVKEVYENSEQRMVRAEVEMGPFSTARFGTELIGINRRIVTVWKDEDYDAVKLTWDNTALIDRIKYIFENGIMT